MLNVNDVIIKYGNFTAVKGLTFNLNQGEILGLLGANGAGKTTTFRAIMGLLPPSEGSVLYNGHQVSYDDVNEIGYMIEERSLLTRTTVKDLITYFGELKGIKAKEIEKRLDYWLKRFNISEYKAKKIKELSKGNQQKIQFISAIINNPKLLILDEPFSGLDVINTEMFIEVIRDFQKNGCMIIFSSHQLNQVENFCEKVVILEKGEVIVAGDILQIKKDFGKRTVSITADNINILKLKELPGVEDIKQSKDELIVKINGEETIKAIFDSVKSLSNLTKFVVSYASLSEIFISKVGELRG